MEKLVRRHSRQVEGRGEQDIEIEQGKWRDQEIRLVHITEFHRFYALSSQDRDSGQYHPKQHDDCQCSEIFWHQNSPLLHPDIQCSPARRESDNLSATYLIRANPLLTYAQKPRTETEEKAYSSERAKEAVR